MSDPATNVESEEVDQRQLELAALQGETYDDSLTYMIDEVADAGDRKRAGDFVVAFALENAEGLWRQVGDGDLSWVEPEGENCHLEVAVTDAADGRFVPELTVRATLTGDDGTEVGPVELPFLWHPGLFHYGANIAVPDAGTYDVRVTVDPPTFPRHDRRNGDRYDGESVVFTDVPIEPGRK